MTDRQLEVLKLNNENSRRITRESLADALITLMKNQKYSSISVTELTKKAGVSRAAFYRNFSSIDEVLDDKITSVSDQISKAVGDDLQMSWQAIFQITKENDHVVKTLILAQQEHKILDYLNLVLPQDTERRMLLVIWNGVVSNLIIQWSIYQKPESPEEMAKLAYEYTKGLPPLQ